MKYFSLIIFLIFSSVSQAQVRKNHFNLTFNYDLFLGEGFLESIKVSQLETQLINFKTGEVSEDTRNKGKIDCRDNSCQIYREDIGKIKLFTYKYDICFQDGEVLKTTPSYNTLVTRSFFEGCCLGFMGTQMHAPKPIFTKGIKLKVKEEQRFRDKFLFWQQEYDSQLWGFYKPFKLTSYRAHMSSVNTDELIRPHMREGEPLNNYIRRYMPFHPKDEVEIHCKSNAKDFDLEGIKKSFGSWVDVDSIP